MVYMTTYIVDGLHDYIHSFKVGGLNSGLHNYIHSG